MNSRTLSVALFLLVSLSQARGEDRPKTGTLSFRTDVAPILVRSCLGCHNDKKPSNGLNIATFAKLKKGGKASGSEILIPGDPDSSELLASLRPDAMPRMPLKQPPLTDEQIKTIERWIKQGAKFDGGSEATTSLADLVDPLAKLPKVTVRSPVSEAITSLAISPDGKILAAAQGRQVLLFDLATSKLTATLADHPGPLTGVRFSPDSRSLIATGGRGGMYGSVIVWDLGSKTKRHDLKGHADSILAADLSSDGKQLATASYDRMVKLWDLNLGKEVKTLKEHTDAVYAVAFSPDGRMVASAGADRTVKFWRVTDGFRIVSLSEAGAEIYALAFAPDGATLYAGGVDRSIRSWKVNGETVLPGKTTFAHDGPVLRLVVAADGTVYSTGEDRAIRLWTGVSLQPVASWTNQADWPMGLVLSRDRNLAAVGRYDGSLDLLDGKTGETRVKLGQPEKPKPTAAVKPQLFRSASLNPPSPRGAARGTTLSVTLTGNGVGLAHRVLIPEAGIKAEITPAQKPDANRLDLRLTVAPDARPGSHRIGVQTPLGTPALQTFVVSEHREVADQEPNDLAAQAQAVTMPCTLTGTIAQPGDRDTYRLRLKAAQPLVLAARAKSIGSELVTWLAVADPSGKIVREARASADEQDAVLSTAGLPDGDYTVRVADSDYAGSPNHFYRVEIAASTDVTSVFPLGIERGRKALFDLTGVNLPKGSGMEIQAAPGTVAGSLIQVPVPSAHFRSIVVADGPQSIESGANDDPSKAGKVETPGGISARIEKEGDVDFFRFDAKKGKPVLIEVFGRRLGSPIDPAIEIVDAKGNTLPRAILRPVEQTTVAFRDHGSLGRNIRLTTWDHLAVGDVLLVGRELMRLSELPRNPDDDAVFWGLGIARTSPGDRLGLLETTPEQHPQAQPMYKVEIHPPGTKLPSGGIAPVVLPYRNDDGGPGFGKDSRLTFDPPADGTYFVRVEDVQGHGGPEYAYHLVVRAPRPDFSLSIATENPNIPRGGATVVTANIQRLDGFNGAVDLEVEGLPPGIRATPTRIEPESFTADFLLMADETAPAFSDPSWTVRARASEGLSSGEILTHTLDPGGANAGWITVTHKGDLDIAAAPLPVLIHPGERVEITLRVKRGPGFTGRVPIDLRNLPLGVRVLHIGLNGILVTEAESARSVFLYAEPWAQPMDRFLYAVGKVESTGVSTSSPPIPLVVRPAPRPSSKPVSAR